MTTSELIKSKRKEMHLTMKQVAEFVGVSEATVSRWESGNIANMGRDKISKLSQVLNISPSVIAGYEDDTNEIIFVDDMKIYNAPIFESVSAGFGVSANSEPIGYYPVMVHSIAEAKDIFCVKVKGDSMYPDIQDGDYIQVHKQTSVDNYDIAVICVDDEDYLVKRVVYGDDFIKLISSNASYAPKVFNGAEVLRCRVVGKVLGSFKKF